MSIFDSNFFNELAKMDALVKLDEYNSALMPPSDGFMLRASELHAASKISDEFLNLTHDFVDMIAKRSGGRYLFEKDFRAYPHHVRSYSHGRSGRKQLYIGFDAYPPSDLFPCPWGVSIGLGFDFRSEHGINAECVNEYEAFIEEVSVESELFDAIFGKLGGYSEPTNEFWERDPVTAEKVRKMSVDVTQNWLFFGRRISSDAITAMGSLDVFVDECIQVFDAICDGGYYHVLKKMPNLTQCINPSMSFESFVTGKANQLAQAAALQAAESPSITYNPLFIYGGVGLGKTHLLQAIGNQFKRNNPQARIHYIHATNFVSDVVRAFQTKQFGDFKQYYTSLDLLLFDDIQFIADKLGTQQELYYVLNWLVDNNKKIVITCDTSPNEMSGITPQLISRFSGGLVVAIGPPDLEMRTAILLNKSASNSNPISEEVAKFVAEHLPDDIGNDIRQLEGVINRINAFARFHKRTITVDLVTEAVSSLIPTDNLLNSSVKHINKC